MNNLVPNRCQSFSQLCGALVVCSCAVMGVTDLHAENRVVVESKIVEPGETNVTVGVYLTNDVSLVSVVIPLEFRSTIGGAFYANNFRLTIQGRATSFNWDIPFPSYSYYGEKSGDCGGIPGYAGGSGTAGAPGFFTSPDATMWVGVQTLGPPFPPGTDGIAGSGTPSLLYTFDVSDHMGVFEIDTSCIAPESHLVFAPTSGEGGGSVIPEFTKGVVTVGTACRDLPMTDYNCDGTTDVMDIVISIDVAFRDAPDPEPCCFRDL